MRRNVRSLSKLLLLFVMTIVLTFVFVKILSGFLFDDSINRSSELNQLAVHRRQGAFFAGQLKNVARKKMDWHDYEFMKKEAVRRGIGEQGMAGHLSVGEDDLKEKLYRKNGFNALLSDKISVNRSIPDIRHKECKSKRYLAELPTVSVVVPVFNEHWSTLLRTVYSVLNRSPPELLVEIILVDDFSSKEFLKEPLDRFVNQHLPKVKVLHLNERTGLIGARLAGARIASGDVLLFLDSHIEANVNWLPPLLEKIADNYKVCVCPFIDVIVHEDFEYKGQDEGARGAFDWQFFYKRLPMLEKDLEHPAEPFESPVMAGGLFAISARFFWELGGYDEGLDIWGGEQYELSFKIWQCGGAMYDVPCSRVGHIYRGPMDSQGNPRNVDFVSKNYKRVAEVWMDEYKHYLYDRSPHKYQNLDPGDLTKQKAIREKLQCKPFKWFIENVAFDLVKKYPPVEPPDYAWGAIQSVDTPHLCVDSLNVASGGEIGLFSCANDLKQPQLNQNWALTWRKDLRQKNSDLCWDVAQSHKDSPVLMWHCHGQHGNQYFFYDPVSAFKFLNNCEF